MKEIKANSNRWKDTQCSWIKELILKMIILPKAIYGFNAIPNYQWHFS